MEKDRLPGYRGSAREILSKAGASVGDRVAIVLTDGGRVEGTLMPRYELADDRHIVVKLDNGYNIGVRVARIQSIEVIARRTLPTPVRAPPPEIHAEERVVILGTGGTIAARVDYVTGGVTPVFTPEDLYALVPELSDIARIETHLLFNIFSENMTPQHWSRIAEATADAFRQGADGVVIAHGTDTMGYTAAALAFALRKLPGPVVLVGAQRSSDRPSSDAATNLIAAVYTAARAPFAEVVVAMHQTRSDTAIAIHRGTRVRKLHSSRRDAFKSVNAPPLAVFEKGELTLLTQDYRARNSDPPEVDARFEPRVALIKFHPGMPPDILEYLHDRGYRGIILEGTGLGHVNVSWVDTLRRLTKDMLVGMCTQTIWGRVNMRVYSTGRLLLQAGVIGLEDMLAETALVKAMWVLAHTDDLEEAKQLMLTNFAGEISERLIE